MRHSSFPVFASCAVITQPLLVACGWHWRPSITLPLAMIGPELALTDIFGSNTAVSHTSFPVRASTAYIWLSELASMSVVPQMAMLRLVDAAARRACTPRAASPVLASTAMMKSPGLGMYITPL